MAFAIAEALEDKQNLRTCGKLPPEGLKLHRHPSVAAKKKRPAPSATVPTIPSRIETVLYKGYREVLGFGACSLRFEAPAVGDEEVPDPGLYGIPGKSFIADVAEKPSWGIRGTGGFASKTRRLGTRSMPQLPMPGRGCPGPGAYNPLDSYNQVRNPHDWNKTKKSASFALADALPSRATVTPSLPGPGTYPVRRVCDPGDTHQGNQLGAVASFKSRSRRNGGVMELASDAPGPGEYFVEDEDTRGGASGSCSDAHDCMANFKDPLPRRVYRVHKDLPTPDPAARGALGDVCQQVMRECTGRKPGMPGPGHYDQDREICEAFGEGQIGSSGFQPAGPRTEWATEETARMPGPGQYNTERGLRCDGGARDVFASASERLNGILGPRAPGPAFYNPKQLPSQKSYHLNMDRRWV